MVSTKPAVYHIWSYRERYQVTYVTKEEVNGESANNVHEECTYSTKRRGQVIYDGISYN